MTVEKLETGKEILEKIEILKEVADDLRGGADVVTLKRCYDSIVFDDLATAIEQLTEKLQNEFDTL